MSVSQKKKNVAALHQAAAEIGLAPLLEVSTKSDEKLGERLSAFNLKLSHGSIDERPLECVYQGSKVFELGGPYTDLYWKDPREAKRDQRLRTSGPIIGFRLGDLEFPASPMTAFYDWLYLRALYPHREFLERLHRYAGFTDIEFNPEFSINCQGRSCATFVSLSKKGQLEEAYESHQRFIEILKPDSENQPYSAASRQNPLFAESPNVAPRSVVFLSHANPEDNAFTLWLAARLAGAGYRVWSDVTKLIGGENFWSDIEDLLRNDAVKVLSIISASSPKKKGVRKELDLAATLESKLKDPTFIVPLLVKGGAFADMPIHIHGKNAISFASDWHVGFAQLLKRLREDAVPQEASRDARYISDWSRRFLELEDGTLEESESVMSNEITALSAMPPIRVFELPVGFDQVGALVQAWPCKAVGKQLIAFADVNDWAIGGEAIPARLRAEVDVQEFIRHGVGALPGQTIQSRRACVSEILRLAWERHARNSGLFADRLANNKLCWFYPGRGEEAEYQPFVDALGKAGKRQLNGQHKSYTWHFAVQAIPRTTEPYRFALKAHVTFSEDGQIPLEDVSRKHSLRRRIAIMWWQDKWRDLLSAYLTKLSGQSDRLNLAVGTSVVLSFSSTPMVFVSPVSPAIDDGLMEPDDEDLVQEVEPSE